jgi:hypothetical protein
MSIAGKTVVFTGTLAMKRADATAKAANAGATVTGSISGKTDIVIVGANAGTKADAAKAKGIAVWTEAEFVANADAGAAAPASKKAPAKKGRATEPDVAPPAKAPRKEPAAKKAAPAAAAAPPAAPPAGNKELDKKLRAAANKGEAAKVAKLIAAGANVNAPGQGGWMALHGVCRNGRTAAHVDVAKLLLDAGAAVNAATTDHHTVPLCLAAWGNPGVAALLLDRGAAIEGNGARTPLHTAAFADNAAVIRVLLQRGADRAAVWEGATPLANVKKIGGREAAVAALEVKRR